jgi:hypothetical protein
VRNKDELTLDAATGKPVPTPGRVAPIKLDTLRHIRDEMGRVYREARAGRIDTQDLTRFVYALDRLGSLVVAMDVEQRLIELEKRHEPGNTDEAR